MRNERRPRSLGQRVGCAVVSAVLAAGLVGVPSAALAEGQTSAALQVSSTTEGDAVFDWASNASTASALSEGGLPAKFDLRDENNEFGNVVTPVKFQNPWGSCWSFGVAAASETSIISEAKEKGIELDEALTDISERHLAWFTYTPLLDDDSDQGGEGMVSLREARLDNGGQMVYGTSLFSSGIGPISEELVPYKGAEETIVYDKNDEGDEYPYYYSPEDDWSVNEELRFGQMVEFEQSVQLPSPGQYNSKGDYDSAARINDAIKQQLYEGRGVAIAFRADQSKPNEITEMSYMNPGRNTTKTWAHYTYDNVPITHAVAIVGWDDTYSKENFGNADDEGNVDPGKQPPRDGAWIVKNSWGSDDEFPNGHPDGWGTDEDGDGGGDGYFYLSYWDNSITKPESFDFAVESTQSSDEYYFVHQYDYMPSANVASMGSPQLMRVANIFEAGYVDEVTGSYEAETVRKLTCETTRPNTHVTFDVYVLSEDATLPTQGWKIATVEKDFEWGGFHAVELTDEQAFTLNAGERFSVVVTQQCLDDGNYYISYDYGWDDVYAEQEKQENYEEYYQEFYNEYCKQYEEAAKEALWQHTYNAAIESGKSEEEAKAAADAYMETEEAQARVKEAAHKAADEAANLDIMQMSPKYYFNAVVNEGESFIYGTDENGASSWRDFTEIAAERKQDNDEADNPPIKAYGYQVEDGYENPAAEESVAQLRMYLASAQTMLASAVESTDGSNVPTSQFWVPADVHAQLAAAITEAEDVLAGESPTQGDVERISLILSTATKAFDEAKQPGTLVDDEGEGAGDEGAGGEGEKPGATPEGDPSAEPVDKSGGSLAKTGDNTLPGIAAASAAGLAALATAIALAKRRRNGAE